MSYLAFCATSVFVGSANAAAKWCSSDGADCAAAREKRSSAGAGERAMGTYQALPFSVANETPTRSTTCASVPVVSVSNANMGAASRTRASARASSSVVTSR